MKPETLPDSKHTLRKRSFSWKHPNTYRVLAVGITSCMVFAGCAPKVMVNPEYKSITFGDKNLNVAIEGSTVVNYEGNMDNEFPPQGRNEKIQTFICSTAVKTLKESSVFRSVNMVPLGCASFQTNSLDWNRNSEEFVADLPDNTCYGSPSPQDIWLFIEQPLVSSNPTVQLITYGLIPVAAIPHKPLSISVKFLYWDPVRKKPIAWGNAMGSYDNGPAVTMTHWLEAMHDCADQIIKDTPFERKAVSK
jgi:hypothetical protein